MKAHANKSCAPRWALKLHWVDIEFRGFQSLFSISRVRTHHNRNEAHKVKARCPDQTAAVWCWALCPVDRTPGCGGRRPSGITPSGDFINEDSTHGTRLPSLPCQLHILGRGTHHCVPHFPSRNLFSLRCWETASPPARGLWPACRSRQRCQGHPGRSLLFDTGSCVLAEDASSVQNTTVLCCQGLRKWKI